MNADTAQTESRKTIRLDQLLVERHGYGSRSRARDAILRGTVSVDGKRVAKPGLSVTADCKIEVIDPAQRYVSRAALKLLHALEMTREPAFQPGNKIALDIGASTGGFTQVLLEHGAAHVYAIDVGSGQVHTSLRSDSRVTIIENLNARDLTPAHLDGHAPQFIVCDTSFISLKLALPPALEMAAGDAAGIFLIKPQFEVGREAIGKGGIVNDPQAAERAVDNIQEWLSQRRGWQVSAVMPSPIEGADGNREFLMLAKKSG